MFLNETNRRKTFGAKELSAEKMSEILQKKCQKHFKKKDNIPPPLKNEHQKNLSNKSKPRTRICQEFDIFNGYASIKAKS